MAIFRGKFLKPDTIAVINNMERSENASRCKMGIPGQVALNDPAQNPHFGNALNDPTPGK